MFTTEVYADKETDYPAFVKEGKVWKCLQPADGSVCNYSIEGDTVINGRKYKKVLCRDRFDYHDDASHYFAAVREEGGLVFVLNAGQEQEYMLYNFEPGEETGLRYDWCGWGVTRSKGTPFWYRGKQHYKFTAYPFILGSDLQPIKRETWVDGLGNLEEGPFFVGSVGKMLLACYENGQCVFVYEDQFHFGESDYPYKDATAETDPRYPAFVREGKVWNCQRPADGGSVTYAIDGDTLISATVYKRVFCQDKASYGDDARHYLASVREDGYRVYVLYAGQQQEHLLYDFEPGKEMALSYDWCRLKVKRDAGAPCIFRSTRHYVFAVEQTTADSDTGSSTLAFWIDGIGSDSDPFYTGAKGLAVLSCYEDENCIYENADCPRIFTAEADGLKCQFWQNSHEARIVNGNCCDGELTIPAELSCYGENYKLTGAEWLAFAGCSMLTKVQIPSTLQEIFHIDDQPQFMNIFLGCTSLQSIDVEEGNPSLRSSDGVLYNGDLTRLYSYPAGSTRQTYVVPKSVSWIGNAAFHSAANLKELVIEGIIDDEALRYNGIFGGMSTDVTLYVQASEIKKFQGIYKGKVLPIEDYVETGIECLPTVNTKQSKEMFDLQGRRLGEKPRKGIYIESGRKQAVK